MPLLLIGFQYKRLLFGVALINTHSGEEYHIVWSAGPWSFPYRITFQTLYYLLPILVIDRRWLKLYRRPEISENFWWTDLPSSHPPVININI